MSKRIITISREFGSGGRFIGEEIAKKLGIAYYDKEIMTQIAERESCVIIGRNADFILKDRDDVLNVFIYGNISQKIERISRLYNVEVSEAKKILQDVDKRRSVNYNFYTDQKWGMASNYTLALNNSELGYGMCEKIVPMRKKRFTPKVAAAADE